MTRRMFRYVIPVDGGPHQLELTSDPVHVAPGRVGPLPVVEFWAEHHETREGTWRTFQVFGTGARTPESLVWHLYELPGGPS